MENLTEKVFNFLINFKINQYKFRDETELEDILTSSLKDFLKNDGLIIKRQSITLKARALIPDITIGQNKVLIEIKILKDLSDVYRIFYQAVKYSKIAKESLIFFIYDPDSVLKFEEIEDLKQIQKVRIIRKY